MECNDLKQDPKTLLIVDDDTVLLRVLSRAMQKFGYIVWPAYNIDDVRSAIRAVKPDFAVIDLHLEGHSGLDILELIKNKSKDTTSVILSGYVNIPSAVEATKLGAVACLTKPIDSEELNHCLLSHGNEKLVPFDSVKILKPAEVRLKHILARWEKSGRNTSQTAKELNMHRRTLQRILTKSGYIRVHQGITKKNSSFKKLLRLYRVWSQ